MSFKLLLPLAMLLAFSVGIVRSAEQVQVTEELSASRNTGKDKMKEDEPKFVRPRSLSTDFESSLGSSSSCEEGKMSEGEKVDWQNWELEHAQRQFREQRAYCAQQRSSSSPISLEQRFTALNDVQKKELLIQEARKINGFMSSPDIGDAYAKTVMESASANVKKIAENITEGTFRPGEKEVILYGKPGTSKSTIPRAMGNQCGIPCLFFAAGTIADQFQNAGNHALREMFELASAYAAPCIIVIDELEVLIKKQEQVQSGDQSMLTVLWGYIDKLNLAKNKVVVIFTANSKKDLVEAMNSRINKIEVLLPDQAQRKQVLVHHLKEQGQDGYTYDGTIDEITQKLVKYTDEFSHRELRDLVIKATGIAGKKRKTMMKDFWEALKIIANDPERAKARALGTWLYETRKYLKEHHREVITTAAGWTLTLYQIQQSQTNFDIQMNQNQANHREGIDLTKAIDAKNQINNDKNYALQKSSYALSEISLFSSIGGLTGALVGAWFGPVGVAVGSSVGVTLTEKLKVLVANHGPSIGQAVGTAVQYARSRYAGTIQ